MKKIAIAIVLLFFVTISTNAFAQSAETIQILAPWSESQDKIQVVIINKADLDEDKISIIKKAIESDASYVNNGHVYFEGWGGALKTLGTEIKFEISVSEKARMGDIVIELLREKDPQYDGYTIPRYVENYFSSASIQIFDSDNMSPDQLENLMRHEFGHALGLGHATKKSCIMYQTIESIPKLISDCELDGLKALESGLTFKSIETTSV